IFSQVDLLLVPSLRDEMLTITNFTGHPSLTLRTGFLEVSEARSDWALDPALPPPKFSPPRRVPHGVTLIGSLFDEGTLGRAASDLSWVIPHRRQVGTHGLLSSVNARLLRASAYRSVITTSWMEVIRAHAIIPGQARTQSVCRLRLRSSPLLGIFERSRKRQT